MQPGGDQQIGVGLGLDLIVGAVGLHVVVVALLVRVAPLVVLASGEGDGLVQHGGDHVDERHLGHYASIELGRLIDHCPHQQAAGAAAHGIDLIFCAIALRYQWLGDVDEVVEGILFFQQLAIFVPVAAQLLTATDVGDGVDEAPIQQAQAGAAEVGIHAGAIGAVAIDQQRVGACTTPCLLEHVLAIDQRDRHGHAVPGGHPESLAGVLLRLEARHRLLLEQGALAAGHVELIGGWGRGHGGVAIAQGAGLRLRVVGEPGDVGRVVEGDLFLLAVLPVDLAQPGQPLVALFHHQPVPEQGVALQQHVGIGGDHRLPALDRALFGLVQAEVLAVLVGAHIEAATVVI